MVAIAVKKVTYRSVEVFFNEFKCGGESCLGIYGPPGGSEVVYLEEFPDKAVLRLFPARVDAFGKRLDGTAILPAFALVGCLSFSLRSFGPLGSVGRSDLGRFGI